MSWYAAHVILYTKFKDGVQDVFPVWENVYLIEAASGDQAIQKATRLGQEAEGDSSGSYRYAGRLAQWVFAGVRKVIECQRSEQRPESGTEVTYSVFQVSDEETLRRLAAGEEVGVSYEE